MENIIRKISGTLSFIVIFIVSAFIYFNYKGFIIDANGNIVLKKQTAQAQERKFVNELPKNINIHASTKYAVGEINAPLTMYEYSSLGCPHCARFHLDTVPELKKEYVEKGLLRIVFVNMPLDKKSMQGAMLMNCMTYDNYHSFLERLFDKQRFWFLARNEKTLLKYASEFGLNEEDAKSCLANKKLASDIIDDRQQGIDVLKMEGTPAFLFNGVDGNEIIYGAPNYNKIKEYIDDRLKRISEVNKK